MTEQPLPLTYPEQPNPPPRPTARTISVREAALLGLADEVIEWMADEFDPKEHSREGIVADLRRAIGRSFNENGYDIAKALDDVCHWTGIDSELVEILDCWSSHIWDARRAAVIAWVQANSIKPQRSVGDRVSCPHGVGEIGKIELDTAEYVVRTDEWLREHPSQQQHPGSGILVPFEDCKLVETIDG